MIRQDLKLKYACLGLAIGAIVGCSTTAQKEAEPMRELADALQNQSRGSVNNIERPFIVDSGRMKVVGKHFRVVETQNLPKVFDSRFAWRWDEPVSYRTIANTIASDAGISISFSDDALRGVRAFVGGDGNTPDLRMGGGGGQGREQRQEEPRRNQARRVSGGDEPAAERGAGAEGTAFRLGGQQAELREGSYEDFFLSFYSSGTLKESLDKYTRSLGISWRYDEDEVVFFKYERKTYSVDSLGGANSHAGSTSTAVTSNGNANTSSAAQSQFAINNPEIWQVLTSSVQSVLTNGGKFVASPQTGTIEVVDTPRAHEQVAELIKRFNENLSVTIFYKIDIIEALQENTDEFGFNFADLIYNASRGRYSANLTTGLSELGAGASSLAGTVLSPTSRYNGSSILVKALSSKVDVVSHRVLYGQGSNGITVPIQDIREVTYLASRSVSTSDSDSGNDDREVSLEPGVATEGVSIFVTGMRGANGDLLLQSSVDLATIEQIVQQGTEDEFIQGPTIQKKNAVSRSSVTAGDSVIAALIESTVNSKRMNGIGHFTNQFTGGSRQNVTGKRFTVVLVTPYFKAG